MLTIEAVPLREHLPQRTVGIAGPHYVLIKGLSGTVTVRVLTPGIHHAATLSAKRITNSMLKYVCGMCFLNYIRNQEP